MAPYQIFDVYAATRELICQESLRSVKSAKVKVKQVRKALGWRETGYDKRPKWLSPRIGELHEEIHRLAIQQLHICGPDGLLDAWLDGLLKPKMDELVETYGDIWDTSMEERKSADSHLLVAPDDEYTIDLFSQLGSHKSYISLQLEHLAYQKAIRHAMNHPERNDEVIQTDRNIEDSGDVEDDDDNVSRPIIILRMNNEREHQALICVLKYYKEETAKTIRRVLSKRKNGPDFDSSDLSPVAKRSRNETGYGMTSKESGHNNDAAISEQQRRAELDQEIRGIFTLSPLSIPSDNSDDLLLDSDLSQLSSAPPPLHVDTAYDVDGPRGYHTNHVPMGHPNPKTHQSKNGAVHGTTNKGARDDTQSRLSRRSEGMLSGGPSPTHEDTAYNVNGSRQIYTKEVSKVQPRTNVHQSPNAPNDFRKIHTSEAPQGQPKTNAEKTPLTPRCSRCRRLRQACDRKRPCKRCKDAGIGVEECHTEDKPGPRPADAVVHTSSTGQQVHTDRDVEAEQRKSFQTLSPIDEKHKRNLERVVKFWGIDKVLHYQWIYADQNYSNWLWRAATWRSNWDYAIIKLNQLIFRRITSSQDLKVSTQCIDVSDLQDLVGWGGFHSFYKNGRELKYRAISSSALPPGYHFDKYGLIVPVELGVSPSSMVTSGSVTGTHAQTNESIGALSSHVVPVGSVRGPEVLNDRARMLSNSTAGRSVTENHDHANKEVAAQSSVIASTGSGRKPGGLLTETMGMPDITTKSSITENQPHTNNGVGALPSTIVPVGSALGAEALNGNAKTPSNTAIGRLVTENQAHTNKEVGARPSLSASSGSVSVSEPGGLHAEAGVLSDMVTRGSSTTETQPHKNNEVGVLPSPIASGGSVRGSEAPDGRTRVDRPLTRPNGPVVERESINPELNAPPSNVAASGSLMGPGTPSHETGTRPSNICPDSSVKERGIAINKAGAPRSDNRTVPSVQQSNSEFTKDVETSSSHSDIGLDGPKQDLDIETMRDRLEDLLYHEIKNDILDNDSPSQEQINKMWRTTNEINSLVQKVWDHDKDVICQDMNEDEYEKVRKHLDLWVGWRCALQSLSKATGLHPLVSDMPGYVYQEWREKIGGKDRYVSTLQALKTFRKKWAKSDVTTRQIEEAVATALARTTQHEGGREFYLDAMADFNGRLFSWEPKMIEPKAKEKPGVTD